MRSHVIRWLAIPALVAGMALPLPAWAQTPQPPQVPSVGVTPVSTSPNDPNGGQWFFLDNVLPGRPAGSAAKITTPALVPHTLDRYLADLHFVANAASEGAARAHAPDIRSSGRSGDNVTTPI